MFELENEVCGRCKKNFREDEEIVYCPECGTPVHKKCWTGECENSALHGIFQWKSSARQTEPYGSDVGNDNPEIAAASEVINDTFNGGGVDLGQLKTSFKDELFMGVSMAELFTYIGPDSFSRMMFFQRSVRIISTGKKISINVFSGFLMPYYQLYNRMTFLGMFLATFQLAMTILQVILISSAEQAGYAHEPLFDLMGYIPPLIFILRIILVLFGDYLYLIFTVKKIKKIRSAYEEMSVEYFRELRRNGKPSLVTTILTALALNWVTLLLYASL